MNIKNRITRLEEATQTNEGNQCLCFDKQNEALINQAYGDSFNEADILPDETTIVGTCERCQKTISPRVKQMYENLVLMYGDKNEYQTQN